MLALAVAVAVAVITIKSPLKKLSWQVCILSPASHVTRVPVNPQCTLNPVLSSCDWLHGVCPVTWAAGPAAATNKR